MVLRSFVLALPLLAAVAARADADGGAEPPGDPARAASEPVTPARRRPASELAVNRTWTLVFVVAGGAVWLGSDRVWQDTLAPSSCRLFCESRVNALDRVLGDAFAWKDDALPQTISDLSAYVAVPLVAFGGLSLAAYTEGSRRQWVDDLLIVAEATVVTGLVNRISALTFGRTRPRTRYAEPGDPIIDNRQAHESFFSGHTSAAVSVAVAAAEVARIRGYRVEPWLWGSAVGLGALTGYMRLAGRDHWTTDVLTGAAVATTFGVVVPRLHRRGGPELAVAPHGDGATLSLRATW